MARKLPNSLWALNAIAIVVLSIVFVRQSKPLTVWMNDRTEEVIIESVKAFETKHGRAPANLAEVSQRTARRASAIGLEYHSDNYNYYFRTTRILNSGEARSVLNEGPFADHIPPGAVVTVPDRNTLRTIVRPGRPATGLIVPDDKSKWPIPMLDGKPAP